MKKFLRVLHLVTVGVLAFPLIVAVMIGWLIMNIKVAIDLNEPIKYGIQNWLETIMRGIEMNKDFVNNGL